MYRVQCTLCTVYCTMYILNCTLLSAQCTVQLCSPLFDYTIDNVQDTNHGGAQWDTHKFVSLITHGNSQVFADTIQSLFF